MTQYSRITYQMNGGRHTFWSEAEEVQRLDDGSLCAVNLETGCTKLLSASTPYVLTEDVELPAKVKGNDSAEVTA